MNWLLRALGLLRESELTQAQREALAAAREEKQRIDMGMLVLEGIDANTVARTHNVSRDYVIHSTLMALRSLPGYQQARFNALRTKPAFGTLKVARKMYRELVLGVKA